MGMRSLGLKRTCTLAMVLGLIFGVTIAIAICNATAAWAATQHVETSDGDLIELAPERSDLALAANPEPDPGPEIVTLHTATELAAALNEGSAEPVATGDNATGIVTVTGPCDGPDGAGLADISLTPGPQLTGIVFNGEGAAIVFSGKNGGASLFVGSEEASDTPFTIGGQGTITTPGDQWEAIIVGYNNDVYGTLILGDGVIVENTGGARAMDVQSGTCEIQAGATVKNDALTTTLRVGYNASNPDDVGDASVTINGTVANAAGEVLIVLRGLCTVGPTGVLECNTANNYVGLQVGSTSRGTADNVSTLTLDGGTVRDIAGDAVDAQLMLVMGNPAGGQSYFVMRDGKLTGGGPASATISCGYSGSRGNFPGHMRIEGGTVINPARFYTLRVLLASDATVGGGRLNGGIQVASNCTGVVTIAGDLYVLGNPALEVLSPDATVTLGEPDGYGPGLEALTAGEQTIVVAPECTATLLSGAYAPNAGDAVMGENVEAGLSVKLANGAEAEIYGRSLCELTRLATGSSAAVLRAAGGRIALGHVEPGVSVVDASGGDGEIGVVTPYGVVVVGPGLTGVVPGIPENAVTVHRLYNPYLDGAHLLTADTNEVAELEKLGWQDEGARFMEYSEAAGAMTTVYRLYNPNNGDHFFTASDDEATSLESIGWTREGIAWHAPSETTIPAYRLYNPYQTALEGLGNHLWTTLENERDSLVDLGWQSEGIGWYALPLN